ncbi:Aminoglycoside phosphotransferase [Actinomycetales bacterium JB111]|nr:Aminoglycoside phosphotransferase [Actinomycetales bacterium JB111]
MSIPDDDLPVPPLVTRLADGRAVRELWRNGIGGRTFHLDATGQETEPIVLKVAPPHPESDLAAEAERLAWAAEHAPVPRVIDVGIEDGFEWLATTVLPGTNAVEPYWIARPAQAARAVGAALRAWHERMPVADCPWTWTIKQRIAELPATVTAEARAELRATAPTTAPTDLVVCTGDACAPNYLLGDDGAPTGYVDLGALGIGSRWADVAAAEWSIDFNYGPGHLDEFRRGYGLAAPPSVVEWYLRLWTAGDQSEN